MAPSHHNSPCKPQGGKRIFARVGEDPTDMGLSARELEALVLLVDGLSNREIGERLGVSARTAQSHVANAMRKTGTRTRTQLAVHCLRVGLVELHPRPDSAETR